MLSRQIYGPYNFDDAWATNQVKLNPGGNLENLRLCFEPHHEYGMRGTGREYWSVWLRDCASEGLKVGRFVYDC